MKKQALQQAIADKCQRITASVNHLNFAHFFAPFGDKWSVAENILHLTQSVKTLNTALGLPKEMLAQQFGKTDRPSMSYEGVIEKYQSVLATGVQARGAFVPVLPENPEKDMLLNSFLKHHQIFSDALNHWTEEELDSYQIKHPVLKLLTMREMYYFMIYHIGHHQKAIDRILA